MNTTTSSVSSALLAAPYQLNMYIGSFLWVAGNLGCIGNIIVYRSRVFANRAYAIYLLAQAMSDIVYFNFVLLTRVLQKGFQIPATTRFDALCRIRQFLTVWCNQVSFTLFSFATIDRILSAQRENKYRQWSNRIGLAYKMCIACALFWFLLFGHRFILYSLTNGVCGPPAGIYAYLDNYVEVFVSAICPPIAIIILAYLLIKSIRSMIQRKVAANNNQTLDNGLHKSNLQQMDTRLTLMLLLQSMIVIITIIPYAVELTYVNITEYMPKSALRKAQEKIFTEVTHIMSYIFFASGFYVSMISNSHFRRKLAGIFRKPNQVDPSVGTGTVFLIQVNWNTQQK